MISAKIRNTDDNDAPFPRVLICFVKKHTTFNELPIFGILLCNATPQIDENHSDVYLLRLSHGFIPSG